MEAGSGSCCLHLLLLLCWVGMIKWHSLSEYHEAPGMPWVMALMLATCATRESQADEYPTCHMLNGVPTYVLALWEVGLGYCEFISVQPNSCWPGHGVSRFTGLLCQHEQNMHLHLVVDSLSPMPLLSDAKLGVRGDVLGWWCHLATTLHQRIAMNAAVEN